MCGRTLLKVATVGSYPQLMGQMPLWLTCLANMLVVGRQHCNDAPAAVLMHIVGRQRVIKP
jgi:hypothetical protein